MKNTHSFALLLLLLWPSMVKAGDQDAEANVNSKYKVESVDLSGVSVSRISHSLHDDMQKLVGEKYNQEAARALVKRLRQELPNYSIDLKVSRGDKTDYVKVVFEAERNWWHRLDIALPPNVYHSKEGWNGTLEIPIDVGPSVFTFGFTNTADTLLERNAGYRFRYEHKKVGTDRVQLRLEFDTYHQKWNAATEAALAENPEVPGIYRTRQNFEPAVSFIVFRDLKLSVGTSFQRFETQYPTTHTQTAYAGIADVLYRHDWQERNGLRQRIKASYSLRTATRVLDSDFVYTRHFWTADYTLTRGKHLFGAHFQGGFAQGTAPLFERFSLGNSATLRGWNKFDVAPIGGERAAHGSLEYRYSLFQIFYDVGAVWDPGKSAPVRHALGFGLAARHGAFMSLAFPVRLDHVTPVFMVGFRN